MESVIARANEECMLNPHPFGGPVDDSNYESSKPGLNIPRSFVLKHEKSGDKIDRKAMLTTISNSSNIEDAYPCTPLQEGLMALSVLYYGKYMPRMVYSLPLTVDLQRFKLAWQEMVDSNPILRTRITQTNQSEMVQTVFTHSEINWLTATDLDHYLWLDRQIVPRFEMSLFRYAIVRDRSLNINYFVWTVHHAIFNGWSRQLLLDQVEKRYQGGLYSLLNPFRQYVAYIYGQDEYEMKAFWSRKLAGVIVKHFPRPLLDWEFPNAGSFIVRNVKLPKLKKEFGSILIII